jgi:23S rRNA pseudouridine2604 synthase
METLTRINKRMAELGLCSRREADALITAGQVTVNGKKAVIGQAVAEHDVIAITTPEPAKKRYLAYYKGRGIITHSPGVGETDIATRLKNDYNLSDVYPVGRLDKDSEGLMLLTDDGRVTGPLLDPENNIPKTYEVWVDKPINPGFIQKLERGVNIEGYQTKPATAVPKGEKRFYLTITEGKKHQIRRMCIALGYQVQTLKRITIANIDLGNLKPNQYRKLTATEQQELLARLHIT